MWEEKKKKGENMFNQKKDQLEIKSANCSSLVLYYYEFYIITRCYIIMLCILLSNKHKIQVQQPIYLWKKNTTEEITMRTCEI
jgi:hypothetical protein